VKKKVEVFLESAPSFFFCVGLEAQLDECGGRLLLGDDRELSRLAAVDRVPWCWSLVFNWTALYMHIS
jgi:hypothetical protein